MKKYVKILFRSKEIKPLYMELEKWKEIIQSDKTLIPFTKEDGQWTGSTFNKSDIIWADYDEDYTNARNEEKYTYYKNKETNSVVKMLEGQLPDNFDKYEKLA